MKAHLKGSHYVAAIIAGIVGNIFFSAGWSLLGVTLFFGLFAAILGGSIESIIGQFTDPNAISGFFSSAGGIAAGLTVGLSIAALVLVGLGVLFRGLILKGGKVRKPWATTWLSVLISALLSVPLFFVWLAIANSWQQGTDDNHLLEVQPDLAGEDPQARAVLRVRRPEI